MNAAPKIDPLPTIAEAMRAHWANESARRRLEITREVRRRLALRQWAEADPVRRAAVMEGLRRDRKRFFNDWLWTYDPRNVDLGLPTRIPFRLRPRQAAFIDWLQERKETQLSGMCEKSRDEGASFLVLGDMLYDWLFSEGYAGGVGSRKQDLVDRIGDPDTLFAKLRIMLYNLPTWMLPRGFVRKEHDNYLRLLNPENGASITGEGGDNIGRGGRKGLYLVDEWAFVDHDGDVNAALSQTTNVRIKVTTPNGPGNAAYQERFSGTMPVFTLHWKDNPAKNEKVLAVSESGEIVEVYPWYEIQKASPEMTPAHLAQEVDIDWTASVEGAVIPAKWVQSAVGLKLERGGVNRSGLDVSEDGNDRTMYANRKGPVVTRLLEIRGTPARKAQDAEEAARYDEVSALHYDRLGIGAGITATLAAKEKLPFRVIGVSNADKPSPNRFEDQPKVPNSERFAYWSDEQWWALRLRFWRTYQRVTGAEYYSDDECISIPNRPGLVAQLSQPVYAKTSSGKIKVDKKGGGSGSPDEAEAVLYAFAEPVEKRKPDWSNAKPFSIGMPR